MRGNECRDPLLQEIEWESNSACIPNRSGFLASVARDWSIPPTFRSKKLPSNVVVGHRFTKLTIDRLYDGKREVRVYDADVPLSADPFWKRDYAASVRRLVRDGVDRPLANLFVMGCTVHSPRRRRCQSRPKRVRGVSVSASRNDAGDARTISGECGPTNRIRRMGKDGSRSAVYRLAGRSRSGR